MNPRLSLLLTRALASALALLAIATVWFHLSAIARTDPWYRNVDMNIHNMADALSLNSGVPPNQIDQPAVPTKLLLALHYRLMHHTGILPTWNLATFDTSPDPLREFPRLINALRIPNRVLLIMLLVGVAVFVWTISRELAPAALALLLFAGSPAIVFHGMLSRPELFCVLFGCVLALLCTVQATSTDRLARRHLWLLLAGCLCGVALLDKLLGVAYLGMCCAWCWISAAAGSNPTPDRGQGLSRESGWDLLPAISGLALLGLLHVMEPDHEKLGETALLRLRLAALGVAVMPLLPLWPGDGLLHKFCVARVREMATMGAGLLAALTATYLTLRALLSAAAASDYLARVLSLLADPRRMVEQLADSSQPSLVFMQHLQENAGVFLGAITLTAVLFAASRVPSRLRLLTSLLCATALGVVAILSKRHFTIHYEIYYLTPLYLAGTLALWALLKNLGSYRLCIRPLLPVALIAANVLLAFSRTRIQQHYAVYQDDAQLPVNELTLTLLFDHDAKPHAYLDIMAAHYGDRAGFRRAIDAFLADPANRY